MLMTTYPETQVLRFAEFAGEIDDSGHPSYFPLDDIVKEFLSDVRVKQEMHGFRVAL